MDISEKNLEDTIEQSLLSFEIISPSINPDLVLNQPSPLYGPSTSNLTPDNVAPGGYRKHTSEEYDKALCLIPEDVLNFIYATQPKEWDKFKKQHEGNARTPFLQRLASELRAHGTLHVLRKGIKANGCRFQLAYFIPSSGLNYELLNLYAANIFSEVRQLHYSERNNKSLDLVLFLNGLPIFTAELKNPFTGQNVQNAIQQYRSDRDPREPPLPDSRYRDGPHGREWLRTRRERHDRYRQTRSRLGKTVGRLRRGRDARRHGKTIHYSPITIHLANFRRRQTQL